MEITLALDWTPNTNHTGFYVAQAQGLYAAAGLTVRFLSPDADGYSVTPARKVATKQATFGIAPSESAISYQRLPGAPALVAVAAVVQRDTSAIVTLKQSGLDRPMLLDGRSYASYNARYEGAIVAGMIRADGGRGTVREITPPKLGIWNTLLTGQADATWVFLPWEGVEAERRGVALNIFRVGDYGIPYGYSPVLLAHPDTLRDNPAAVRAFLAASTHGFVFAAQQPDAAATLLCNTAQHATLADVAFVRASQRAIAPAYLTDSGRWGVMDRVRWQTFVDWLTAENALKPTDEPDHRADPVATDALFTNLFLETEQA